MLSRLNLLTFLMLFLTGGSYATADVVILEDDFNREETDDTLEEVGNGWKTNSKSRAQGVKQVDLKDGAMLIKMADVADHGVSVVHEAEFKDATIELRFKLGKKDDLGINIADQKEKSVHAGHMCMARIRPYRLQIDDLKYGKMMKEMRERRKAKKETAADKELLKTKTKSFKLKLKPDTWHDLKMTIKGDRMTVSIDGEEAGSFESPGIGHPTKRMIRLAVNNEAWVDDLKVTRHE